MIPFSSTLSDFYSVHIDNSILDFRMELGPEGGMTILFVDNKVRRDERKVYVILHKNTVLIKL